MILTAFGMYAEFDKEAMRIFAHSPTVLTELLKNGVHEN